jgi:hypothetical protein
MQWKGQAIGNFIAIDDEITVSLGYKNYKTEIVFAGYISTINQKELLTITCENEMRRFKKITVKPENFTSFDIKTFMLQYAPQVNVIMPEKLSFGSLNIETECSLAYALDQINQKYPYVKPFFIFNNLYVLNRSYQNASSPPVRLETGRNIISDTIKYTRKEDVKIAIKAVLMRKNEAGKNEKLEVTLPKNTVDTELRTFYAPNCKTIAELTQYAQNMLDTYKCDKAEGTISLFGIPFVRKTDTVTIKDADRPELNGKAFFVNAVKYNFGTSGYRQTITLSDQIKI